MKPDARACARLLLIRHGETDWNAEARIQGHRDIALSPRGRQQALALARHFAAGDPAGPIGAVYASDLARARATAEPVAQALGLGLRTDARLRERAFGLFEGCTIEEAQAHWPAEFALWRRREPAHALPGGESYLQTRARVLQALAELVERHAGEAIAVVTHGGVLDVVYRAAHAIAWETPRSHLLPNASINRVHAALDAPRRELSFVVESWAEDRHLDGARDETAA